MTTSQNGLETNSLYMTDSCPHPRNNLHENERVSRFIFDEKHLRTKSQAAFRPNKELKFSIYRTTKLQEHKIWGIGNEYVAYAVGKPIIGRADISASAYYESALHFDPNGKPHTRHADVLGWNTNKPDDLERRMRLAMTAQWIET